MAGSRIFFEVIAIYDDIEKAYNMISVVDPCKKCLVRPCCQNRCQTKQNAIDIMAPFGFIEGKVIAWFTVFTALFVFITFTVLIFRVLQ